MISYSDLKAYSSNCVNITEFRCHMHMKEKTSNSVRKFDVLMYQNM